MARLRDDFGIELEMASGDYALAMTGLGTTDAHLHRLAGALAAIDATLTPTDASAPVLLPPPPEQLLPPAEALAAPRVRLPLIACENRTAAGYLWAYPPGIPLLAPGQRISADTLSCIETLRARGVSLPFYIDAIK